MIMKLFLITCLVFTWWSPFSDITVECSTDGKKIVGHFALPTASSAAKVVKEKMPVVFPKWMWESEIEEPTSCENTQCAGSVVKNKSSENEKCQTGSNVTRKSRIHTGTSTPASAPHSPRSTREKTVQPVRSKVRSTPSSPNRASRIPKCAFIRPTGQPNAQQLNAVDQSKPQTSASTEKMKKAGGNEVPVVSVEDRSKPGTSGLIERMKKAGGNEVPVVSVEDRSKPGTSGSIERMKKAGGNEVPVVSVEDRSKPGTSGSIERMKKAGGNEVPVVSVEDRSKPGTSGSIEKMKKAGRNELLGNNRKPVSKVKDQSKPETNVSMEKTKKTVGNELCVRSDSKTAREKTASKIEKPWVNPGKANESFEDRRAKREIMEKTKEIQNIGYLKSLKEFAYVLMKYDNVNLHSWTLPSSSPIHTPKWLLTSISKQFTEDAKKMTYRKTLLKLSDRDLEKYIGDINHVCATICSNLQAKTPEQIELTREIIEKRTNLIAAHHCPITFPDKKAKVVVYLAKMPIEPPPPYFDYFYVLINKSPFGAGRSIKNKPDVNSKSIEGKNVAKMRNFWEEESPNLKVQFEAVDSLRLHLKGRHIELKNINEIEKANAKGVGVRNQWKEFFQPM